MLLNAITPIYKSLCPVCGGDASSLDIELHGSCSKCVVKQYSPLNIFMDFISSSEAEFSEFFEKVTGFKPWGAQKHWLRRILRGENTVLVAPTGVGKTTLLIAYALYSSMRNKRVLYITPTRSLLNQTYKKLLDYAGEKFNSSELICYDSTQSKKRRQQVLKQIKECDFKLLVVTNSFLSKNYELLRPCRVDIVIVDDVDSLLKSEKSVYNLIRLLGYSEKTIELAKRRLNLLWRILVGKVYGKNMADLVKEYVELDKQIEEEISGSKLSQLIVASATGRSRGLAGKILKDLLKIDLSGISIYGRNITDSYLLVDEGIDLLKEVAGLVKKLGKGCIIYLSPRHPLRSEYEKTIEKLISELEEYGLKTAVATPKTIAEFTNGKIDVLIGYSTYYGSSVRGIDAPMQIKYTIFLGTPVFSINIENFLAKINMLSRTLLEISSRRNDSHLRKTAMELRRNTLTLSPSERRIIRLCLTGKLPENTIENLQKLNNIYREVKKIYLDAVELVKSVLDQERVLHLGTITLMKNGNQYLALIPDVMTYIQASGRTSRLVGDKMTHGFSVVIERKYLGNLVKGLEARLKSFSKDIGFKPVDTIVLEDEVHRVKTSREENNGSKLRYRSVLLVVESPTKAKTIAKFFGKPSARKIGEINVYTIPAKIDDEIVEFNIVSTRGHIFDLTTNNELGLYGVLVNELGVSPFYTTIKKCRICGTQFVDNDKCPRCGSSLFSDSRYVVDVLRKIASEVEEVYIATDPDLEGEKIAYDVSISVKPFNKNIWRIELHEITIQELLKAIKNKREINRKLVEAEMYRRILDRFVGFALSNKIQVLYGLKYLGAGRVQTPVLGLIIQRYREYLASKCKKVLVKTSEPLELVFSFLISKDKRDLIEKLRNIREVEALKLSEEVVEVSPKPPYTTDELLADASRIGLTVDTAMKIAQELFEAGLITYHRTDSTYVSNTGITIARDYLNNHGLVNYFKPAHWGDQGAHEAIRPVYPLNGEELLQAVDEGIIPVVIPLTGLHLKVYDLIFKRFIASQMKPFKAVKAKFSIRLEGEEITVLDVIVDILEDGFNKVMPVKVYPDLKNHVKTLLKIQDVTVTDTSKAPLYAGGDVVLLMKKLGIGRPSTYAKIISSIIRHGYVLESRNKKKLIPTKKGIEVYEYLKTYYPDLVSVEMTRKMELVIDKITIGEISGYEAISDVLISLSTYKLIDESLISSLNSNSNVGFTSSLNNFTTN
ncbi:MAG: reverse gyrase [Desulfurococcaceae archaeon]